MDRQIRVYCCLSLRILCAFCNESLAACKESNLRRQFYFPTDLCCSEAEGIGAYILLRAKTSHLVSGQERATAGSLRLAKRKSCLQTQRQSRSESCRDDCRMRARLYAGNTPKSGGQRHTAAVVAKCMAADRGTLFTARWVQLLMTI